MMAGVRTCFTVSVACAGAGVIVFSPVAPVHTAAHAVETRVQLTAVPSPLVLYPQVIARSAQNTAALVGAYFSDPLPLTRLTIDKQSAALVAAVGAIGAGDLAAAVKAVGDALLQPIRTAFGAIEYFDTLINQPDAPGALFQIAFSPFLSGVAALGVAIGDVIDAAMAFDLVGMVNAVINIPARVIDGVLNGGYGSPFGDFDNLPGLLTPLTVEGYLAPGPIALAITIDQDAADYIEEQDDTEDTDDTEGAADAVNTAGAATTDTQFTDETDAERLSESSEVDAASEELELPVDDDATIDDIIESVAEVEAGEEAPMPKGQAGDSGGDGDSGGAAQDTDTDTDDAGAPDSVNAA